MNTPRILYALAALLSGAMSVAQDRVEGEVTYVTANNLYVRFTSTETIAIGDTLYLVKKGSTTPCLVVHSKSSTSCVCKAFGGYVIVKGDPVFAKGDRSISTPLTGRIDSATVVTGTRERIRGRLSAASYSTMAAERDDDHRLMYRLALNADHIRNSRFSAETYLNYRQLFPSEPKAYPQQTEFFNVSA
ncbi:MAG: hypothetical protein IPP33_11000 [Flavobacteriales bacterium]|nr:hypothetical protein [Flavobacteriales bacterium]